jgi:PAS domain-containing protein
MSWQPVQGEDGRFLGVRGSVRDVTEMNAAEKESLRLLQAYRTLAQHFPKGLVALLDSDLRFVVCDGPAFSKMRLDPKRFIGKRFDRVMEPKVLERLTPMLMNAREGHDVEESLEYDGQTWLIHFTPVRGEGEVVRHVIASAVIAEKESEKRLER